MTPLLAQHVEFQATSSGCHHIDVLVLTMEAILLTLACVQCREALAARTACAIHAVVAVLALSAVSTLSVVAEGQAASTIFVLDAVSQGNFIEGGITHTASAPLPAREAAAARATGPVNAIVAMLALCARSTPTVVAEWRLNAKHLSRAVAVVNAIVI